MKRDDEPIISINIILIGLVLLFIVLGVLSFVNILVRQYTGHIMELGSISDWVSTGCNVVMACAAVYAAYEAYRWINKPFLQKAYELGDELINVLIPNLSSKFDEIHNIFTITHLSITVLPQNDYSIKDKIESLSQISFDITELKNVYKRIKSLGISMPIHEEKAFNYLTLSLHDLTSKYKGYYFDILLDIQNNRYPVSTDISERRIQPVNDKFETIQKIFDEFSSLHNRHIKYFKVVR